MNNETILIVDDEKEIADLLEVYLKNEGYIIRKFYDPVQALDSVLAEPVSLAVLDVMMREWMALPYAAGYGKSICSR